MLWDVTCYMRSQCYLPFDTIEYTRLNPIQRLVLDLPGGMEGWVDLGDRLHINYRNGLPSHRRSPIQVLTQHCTVRPGVELAICWSQVRPLHYQANVVSLRPVHTRQQIVAENGNNLLLFLATLLPGVDRPLCIGYNIVWSGLCECNEHDPLQTCCYLYTYFMVDWLCTS